MRIGDRLSSWELLEELGSGGNGDVWRAVRDDGLEGALKILRRSSRDRRARFRAEIDFLLNHEPGPGVLPLIDFALPQTGSGPAWYVMPLATVLPDALGSDAELEERVRAIAAVASTLAGLAARGIGHRDIKPDNLFELDGEYLVGDFGLVTYPEKEPVTRAGRRVGPTDYLAPEMRADADEADAEPADVYALAKTMWVILTGQTLPLPGPHRIDDEAYQLATYLSHLRLNELDLLLEACTKHSAADRPSLSDVAAELSAWLQPALDHRIPSLTDIASRVRGLSERGMRERDLENRRRTAFDEAWSSAIASLHPLLEAVSTVFPSAGWLGNPDLGSDFGAPAVIRERRVHGVFGTNADPEPVQLVLAVGAQWVVHDEVRWAGWIRVEDPYAGPRVLWTDWSPAALGSATQRKVVDRLVAELEARLLDASVFALRRIELRVDEQRYACWTGEESDAGRINSPWAIVSPLADGDRGCYVVDSGNNRVVRFGPGGRLLRWRSGGGPGSGYDNLSFPTGGCFDHTRYIWIADHENARLRRFDELGGAVEGFGLQSPGSSILQAPADVASGPDGSVYVVDRVRDHVIKFGSDGQVITEWGGSGRDAGQLSVPCGVAVRHGAFVYVSDSGNDRIQKFTTDGELVLQWGGRGCARGCFSAPHGIALDIEENLYVADCDNHRIQQFTSTGEFVRCWGANGGDGSPGTDPGQFIQPRGVSIDGAGHIYVAEFGGHRVQRFGPGYLAAL